jgi:hypothetical protein
MNANSKKVPAPIVEVKGGGPPLEIAPLPC